MCDNVNLTLNFFESRNTAVITSLLDLSDEVVDTLSDTEFKWVSGNSLRAHGGFVKKISGEDNFKAYILPNVAKLSFEKLKVTEVANNNDDDFDVSGNDTELTFKLENKEVVYKLCTESIVDVENELADNDEEQVEDEEEINRGLEGDENGNTNQAIHEVNENANANANENANVAAPANDNANANENANVAAPANDNANANENANVAAPANDNANANENANVAAPANDNANANENANVAAPVPANANEAEEAKLEEPKGLLERATEFVKNNLLPENKKEEGQEAENNTGPLLESPELKPMSLPDLGQVQNNNAAPANVPVEPVPEMNAPANPPFEPAMNAPANMPVEQAPEMPASNNKPPAPALEMPANNQQQAPAPEMPALNNKPPAPALEMPANNQQQAPPMPTAFKAPASLPAPTMPVPAPTPPVMTGGNYYEDSIKENFQIGNARTNRNKSKKRKVRRGTSLSKKGRTDVKVL